MKVLHLRLKKGKNIVRLRGANLNTNRDKTLRVSRCSALWSLKNIRKDFNDTIVIDSTEIVLPEGYYTFSELETLLKSHDITIKKRQDNRITIISTKKVRLKKLGELLGFKENAVFLKDTTYISVEEANMTNFLKDIFIFCPSLVDGYKNYSYLNGQYIPSSLMFSASIDTTQKLDGTITNFTLDDTKIPLSDFTGQDIEFEVVSGGHKKDYEIRLTISIN